MGLHNDIHGQLMVVVIVVIVVIVSENQVSGRRPDPSLEDVLDVDAKTDPDIDPSSFLAAVLNKPGRCQSLTWLCL
jgi:hypothetical protein